jgi:hypothetical protein
VAGYLAPALLSWFPAFASRISLTHPSLTLIRLEDGSIARHEELGYAAFEMQTAQTEVAFRRAGELKEVGWKAEEVSPYIDDLADFRHEFHDIREDPDFVDCLDPNSYSASQNLGLKLLTSGSAGIVYPSVRHKDGVCIACFRPPLVLNVQQGPMVKFTFIDAEMTGVVIET